MTVRETGKQSRRFWLPIVHETKKLDQLVEMTKEFDQVLICHETASLPISKAVENVSRTLIVIGPEGGISDKELELFESAGGKIIRLGRPVLRSAHAGIAAVSAVSTIMKVW